MIRLLLIVVILALAVLSGIAVILHHYFGWKGLIAFPFLLIGLLWVGKIIIGKMIKKFFLSLFSAKSKVLEGATMTVHSIIAVPAPVSQKTTVEVDEEDAESEGEQEDAEELKHYFQVDMTITPSGEDRVWEPGEFILTSERIKSLEDLEEGDKELGNTHEVQVWDGNAFGPDEAGKYPGTQRLLVTFAVKPETANTWLHYYDVPIGALELPAIKAG